MAEPSMNPNSQEQMMLVQSFEQMANAVGAEIPVNLSSEIAAVKAGKRMSGELQRMLAEGSMSLMNQLNPEMMDSLIRSGQVTPDQMSTYEVDGRMERMAPSQMGGVTRMPSKNYSPSSGVTMEPNVMTMEEAVDAGLVTPTRPRMRPAAPATSMRPQARPMR